MLGMSQQRLGAANAARDAATKSIIGGVSGLAGAALPQIPGLGGKGGDFVQNMFGLGKSDQGPQKL